jgi:hypothetical protein
MRYLPIAQMTLDVPQRPSDMANPRVWNRLVKSAARGAVILYHAQHINARFEPGASSKYSYFARTPKYLERKEAEKGHAIDLVYGGGSKRHMRQHYKIRAGGSAEGGNLSVTLSMRFDFAGGTGRSRSFDGSNPVGRMIADLQKFTDDDRREIIDQFNVLLMQHYLRYSSRRKRIRSGK